MVKEFYLLRFVNSQLSILPFPEVHGPIHVVR